MLRQLFGFVSVSVVSGAVGGVRFGVVDIEECGFILRKDWDIW